MLDKSVDGLLADFSPLGKIDLADFMEKHYMFNMSMESLVTSPGAVYRPFTRISKRFFIHHHKQEKD
jgi:hypothetical protein